LKQKHYQRLENGEYSTKTGVMFLDYLSRMEKIGDHLFNVNEAIAGRKVKSAYSNVIENIP
jgi:phosphate:Na+ symporter